MKRFIFFITLFQIIACSNDDDYVTIDESEVVDEREQFPGGETTVIDASSAAFEFSAGNLDNSDLLSFFGGNSLFEQAWVTAPASTTARDGLGPVINARACANCHDFDGRGHVPEFDGDLNHGLLLRLNQAQKNEFGAYIGDPVYGGQLQDQSISNVIAEGNFKITYADKIIEYPDGNQVALRVPSYEFTNLGYGEMDVNTKISPRIANQMIGLGLLEAISEEDLSLNVDEFDADSDGISGRFNQVYDYKNNATVNGRFGWKANQPSLEQQIAGAFQGDMGLTSKIFQDENCTIGIDCESIINGNNEGEDYEISDNALELVTFYSSTLAVPIRRDFDTEETIEGKKLFFEAKCNACHVQKYVTGSHAISALEEQIIYPYTDLLLHDMGDDLADEIGDFMATPNEWRTPPLWGLGLIETVNGHTELLHDGRARNVEEAILWHGGEAQNAKETFMSYSENQRQRVIDFINTL